MVIPYYSANSLLQQSLRIMSSNIIGADQWILLHAYRLIIHPKLDYGCVIYEAAARESLRQLDTVHHEALRICLGSFRSTPVESLYIMSNEPSLTDRRQDLMCRYFYKLKSHITNPARACVIINSLINEQLNFFSNFINEQLNFLYFFTRSSLYSVKIYAMRMACRMLHYPKKNLNSTLLFAQTR